MDDYLSSSCDLLHTSNITVNREGSLLKRSNKEWVYLSNDCCFLVFGFL